ncbi:MAG: hypothetical protein EPN70_19810 [Paraburkholderia sp.]|uniref:hypothetical protein n=1 Tax=Paraburkholderia sp. TaxID=1926495 RepID=UPI0012190EB4|nr:hypothetical protein [Paraburkholderia sp.]TAM01360.1 MAG: hypothetical protein EPN70_19810 [Paraburkholderia sp.]
MSTTPPAGIIEAKTFPLAAPKRAAFSLTAGFTAPILARPSTHNQSARHVMGVSFDYRRCNAAVARLVEGVE